MEYQKKILDEEKEPIFNWYNDETGQWEGNGVDEDGDCDEKSYYEQAVAKA